MYGLPDDLRNASNVGGMPTNEFSAQTSVISAFRNVSNLSEMLPDSIYSGRGDDDHGIVVGAAWTMPRRVVPSSLPACTAHTLALAHTHAWAHTYGLGGAHVWENADPGQDQLVQPAAFAIPTLTRSGPQCHTQRSRPRPTFGLFLCVCARAQAGYALAMPTAGGTANVYSSTVGSGPRTSVV